MTQYQEVKLYMLEQGAIGDLPPEFANMGDELVADLSWLGEPLRTQYQGTGFWPIVPAYPDLDPATQRLGAPIIGAPDKGTRTVPATYAVIDLTADELAQAAAERFAAVKARVDAETDRRTAAGFTFRGIAYQSRPGDYTNFAGASTAALGAIVGGAPAGNLRWADPAKDFTWTATDNSETPLDAQSMFALGQAAMGHLSKQVAAGRALKNRLLAGETIGDVTDAQYWPA